TASAAAPRSPALVARLTRSAVDRVHAVGDGRSIDASQLRTNAGIFASVVAATLLITAFGPDTLRHGARLVAAPSAAAAAAGMFTITVDPGNVTVPKGGDELVAARLNGFQSANVELLVRPADATNWTRLPMT